jgi:hypothetical protein
MPNRDHQLKRIVLPSGKTIEVVFFDHPSAAPPKPAGGRPVEARPVKRKDSQRELHVCVNCDSTLVYPVAWDEADERTWHVTLRCPNCEWTEAGVFPQDQCDRFDDELEAGTEALTRDYRQLVTANMVEEIERFAAALEADAILPVDF